MSDKTNEMIVAEALTVDQVGKRADTTFWHDGEAANVVAALRAANRLVGEPTDEQVTAGDLAYALAMTWKNSDDTLEDCRRIVMRAALTAAGIAPQSPSFISENGHEQPFHSIRAFFLREGFFEGRDHHERVSRAGELARKLISVMVTTSQTPSRGERHVATIAGRRGGKQSQMLESLLELAAERGLDVQLVPPVYDETKLAEVIGDVMRHAPFPTPDVIARAVIAHLEGSN